MRLVRVELTRFRSRRAVVLMLLAAGILAAVLAGATILETRPVSAADQAAAQAMADAEADQPYVRQELARCQRNPERYGGRAFDAAGCEGLVVPQPDWFLQRSTLSLHEERTDSGLATIIIVCAIMVIVGTTFAGADWASGSVSNQLLFEPRRLKVWLAKSAAVVVATLVTSVLIVAGFWLALYVAAEARDIATPVSALEQIAWLSLRGVALSALGALGGFALTMLVRHTVGTLAVMFVYSVGGEALTAALPFPGVARLSLVNNLFAWLLDGHEYYDSSINCDAGQNMCDQTALLTLSEGATYLAILLLVVVFASMVSFLRRDVP